MLTERGPPENSNSPVGSKLKKHDKANNQLMTYNIDRGRHYLLNQSSGASKLVTRNGEEFSEFMVGTTGYMNYH